MPLWILFCILSVFRMTTASSQVPWPPKEAYIEQRVDHFSFSPSKLTFPMRYLYEDRWYKPGGPILFYCGNEGSIEEFWNNTGYMFELGRTMNAMIVFGEHRYYGKSLPFQKSFEQPYIQYLSIEHTLTDFAYLISKLKKKYGHETPLVTFGGSYGGMLSAFMRIKYPHLVVGAISASSPLLWVAGQGNLHDFFVSVTEDFSMVTPNCSSRIKRAFQMVEYLYYINPRGLQSKMRLCQPVQTALDFTWMLKWARNAFVIMAMFDYPVQSSMFEDLPAYSVNVSCKHMLLNRDIVDALIDAVGVMYNSSGKESCFDYKQQFIECADITGCGVGNDSFAWDFQCCTEIPLYDPSPSTDADMFPSLPLTKRTLIDYCRSRWGVTPMFEQMSIFFGPEILKTASNIVFSNGDLDPWMKGGILKNLSDTVHSIVIHGGAHHLDLMSSNPMDPPSVVRAREFEAEQILKWIAQSLN